MKKNRIISLLICLTISICSVLVLFSMSKNIIYNHNSFIRLFPPHIANESVNFDTKYNSYYIAGVTKNKIYLGNYTSHLRLLILSKDLLDTQHVKIDTREVKGIQVRSIKIKIDSPKFYLTDGTIPIVLTGGITDWKAKIFQYDSMYFSDYAPIGNKTAVIRALSKKNITRVLGKISVRGKSNFVPSILEKQVDGIFCTDGLLNYNQQREELIYTYFYRNQYIVMDTNLSVIYRGKTIDTISHAKIKVATISSTNSRTMAAPPLMVNKLSRSYGKLLYICSALMAKNESIERFKEVSVIDVYDLEHRNYKYSFYIKNINNHGIRDFEVYENKLIALSDTKIVVYDLLQ